MRRRTRAPIYNATIPSLRSLKMKLLRTSVLALVAGCAADSPDLITKEHAAAGKADATYDVCAAYGWYGDGVCDTFCPDPDPDCCTTFAETDAACANGVDDDCDGLVDCADSDCLTSLSCV